MTRIKIQRLEDEFPRYISGGKNDPLPIYIGVDPGVNGGWAVVDHRGRYLHCGDLPFFDAGKSFRLLNTSALLTEMEAKIVSSASDKASAVCMIEHVASMPKQGVVSTFNFGATFGQILAAISTLGVRVELVKPQVWKKRMKLSPDKEASRAKAIMAWPAAAEVLARKKDHNRAEALFLAEYARQQHPYTVISETPITQEEIDGD